MKNLKIGPLETCPLALGTMHLGDTWDHAPLTQDAIENGVKLIETALALGINLIDLADIYTFGKSEMVVGEFFKRYPHKRDSLILQAKCGIILEEPKRYDSSFEHIVKQVDTTLASLGTDRVELLAIHRPDPLTPPEEIARAFDHLKSSGKVLHFGVSNHNLHQLRRLQRVVDQPLVVNQMELSLTHHALITEGIFANQNVETAHSNSGLLDYCQDHNIVLQAWSPVGGGKVFEGSLGETVTRIAQAKNVSNSAIALAWLLRHPAPIQPVLGTRSGVRLREFKETLSIELSREDWYRLLEAGLGHEVP